MKSGFLIVFLRLFFAALLAVGAFLLLPMESLPWLVKVQDSQFIGLGIDQGSLKYVDLNGDGKGERVLIMNTDEENDLAIQVLDENNASVSQVNLDTRASFKRCQLYFHDLDNDSILEALVFSADRNGIFLEVVHPLMNNSRGKERFRIDTLDGKSNPHMTALSPRFLDLDKDGVHEILFSLQGTYESSWYRKMARFNWATKEVLLSKDTLGNVFDSFFIGDYDGDGRFEISGSMGSPGNIEFPQRDLRNDYSAWLIQMDLETLALKPGYVKFPGPFTIIDLVPEIDDPNKLIGLHYHYGADGYPTYLFRSTSSSTIEIVDTLSNLEGKHWSLNRFRDKKNEWYLAVSDRGSMVVYNKDLQRATTKEFKRDIAVVPILDDLNEDGKPEIILRQLKNSRLTVVNPSGDILAQSDSLVSGHRAMNMGIYKDSLGSKGYLYQQNELILVDMVPNKWFTSRWFILVGLFLLFGSMFWGLGYFQDRSAARQRDLIQKMNQLQLQSVKNQLDPHFTFNALTVLSYLSSQKDHEGVESFTHHFSKLLRTQLEMSDQPAILLEDELEFVRHYIELQKLRFDFSLTYKEEVEPTLAKDLRIPKMMIHSHVENAIKHGLLPKGDGSELVIVVGQDSRGIRISISDNGIGRNLREGGPDSTGKGLQILDQMYELFYQLYKIRIRQEFIDLQHADGTAAGTEVRIWVG